MPNKRPVLDQTCGTSPPPCARSHSRSLPTPPRSSAYSVPPAQNWHPDEIPAGQSSGLPPAGLLALQNLFLHSSPFVPLLDSHWHLLAKLSHWCVLAKILTVKSFFQFLAHLLRHLAVQTHCCLLAAAGFPGAPSESGAWESV